jgi:hypothetical protein
LGVNNIAKHIDKEHYYYESMHGIRGNSKRFSGPM